MIDAIGSTLGANTDMNLQATSLSQEDFLKLFLTELNFQDPLEPIDNREFLAQIAQFAALEQNRQTTENIESLVFLNSTSQSVELLGKEVQLGKSLGEMSGSVTAVRFSPEGAMLTVGLSNGGYLSDVRLSEVTLVR
ncbi:hypothetical protein TDB9533_02879 [Thalassocella blandensis]|nr:hypothetical protein TDB9533_02879 [Thalassocella blandensis]